MTFAHGVVRGCLLLAIAALPAAAAPAREKQAPPDADQKAVEGFKLTVPLLDKATAVHQALLLVAQKDPKAAAALENAAGGGRTLAETAALLEANPVAAAALKAAGTSGREYLLIVFSAMTAGAVADLAKQLGSASLPPGVNRANLSLISKEGAPAWRRLQESSRKLSEATRKRKGPAGGTGESDDDGESDPAR